MAFSPNHSCMSRIKFKKNIIEFQKDKGGTKGATFLFVRPAGRTYLEVQVLYRPDRGNGWLIGKGVHREVESEGSRRQSAGLTNRNRI